MRAPPQVARGGVNPPPILGSSGGTQRQHPPARIRAPPQVARGGVNPPLTALLLLLNQGVAVRGAKLTTSDTLKVVSTVAARAATFSPVGTPASANSGSSTSEGWWS